MKPVRPEELSALLDGELSPERADQVRAQLNVDSAMTKEFEALTRLDGRWRNLAAAAQFEPQVGLPRRQLFSLWPAMFAAALVLTGIRLAPKFLDSPIMGLALNVVSLLVLVGAVFWLLRRDASPSPFDRTHGEVN